METSKRGNRLCQDLLRVVKPFCGRIISKATRVTTINRPVKRHVRARVKRRALRKPEKAGAETIKEEFINDILRILDERIPPTRRVYTSTKATATEPIKEDTPD